MIPLIEREVIDRRGWVAREEFLELLTIAQSAPGPISLNTSVFVGYKVRGLLGAVAAILGVVIPSFVVILIVAIFFANIRHNEVVDAAFKAMRPAVVALIVAPVIGLAGTLNLWLVAVAALVAVAVWWLGWSPIYLLLAGAAAGIAWSVWSARKEGRG